MSCCCTINLLNFQAQYVLIQHADVDKLAQGCYRSFVNGHSFSCYHNHHSGLLLHTLNKSAIYRHQVILTKTSSHMHCQLVNSSGRKSSSNRCGSGIGSKQQQHMHNGDMLRNDQVAAKQPCYMTIVTCIMSGLCNKEGNLPIDFLLFGLKLAKTACAPRIIGPLQPACKDLSVTV